MRLNRREEARHAFIKAMEYSPADREIQQRLDQTAKRPASSKP